MAFICAVVIRGTSAPCVVLLKSSIAEGDGLVVPIPTLVPSLYRLLLAAHVVPLFIMVCPVVPVKLSLENLKTM